jgi:hypothetical protein
MKPISMHDIAHALAHCDPDQLAVALAQAGAESITHAAHALEAATDLVATFPRDEVIAEADALLYDVLRWPVADAVPDWERFVTPESFAARRCIAVGDAELTLDRLRDSEAAAAQVLVSAGPLANYTLEQSQVVDCIEALMQRGLVPTRDLVRVTALAAARAAMRPSDGHRPILYSLDDGLAPRIMSPSPKVHAVLWLQRMDASTPSPGSLDERIGYLRRAAKAMGAGAAAHGRVVDLPVRTPNVSVSTASLGLDTDPAMGLVS